MLPVSAQSRAQGTRSHHRAVKLPLAFLLGFACDACCLWGELLGRVARTLQCWEQRTTWRLLSSTAGLWGSGSSGCKEAKQQVLPQVLHSVVLPGNIGTLW